MAASEDTSILNSWKSPLVTPIRKDENACKDIFQNSEKLLASAVSICRLKGSVECQTGGLITVCEELQSLIRSAFSEIRRVEKDFRSQESYLEDEISYLKERVKYLEEENFHSEPLSNEEGNEQTRVTPVCDGRESGHVKANQVNSSCSSPVGEENLAEEYSDPYSYGVDATDITEVPTDDVISTNEQKVASSPRENEKLISKKRLNKLSSKKFADQFHSTNEVADSHSKNLPSSVVEDDCKRQGSRSKQASNAEKSHTAAAEQEPSIDHEACGLPSILLANSKKQQQKRKTKTSSRKENGELTKASSKPKSLKRNSSRRREVKENRCDTEETSVAEMSEASLQEESDMGLEGNLTDIKENINPKKSKRRLQGEGASGDAKLQKGPEKKKGNKKNKSIEFEEESDEVSPEESPRNTTRINTKGKKKDSLHSGDEENTNKDRSCKKTSKADSDDNEATNNCKQFEPDNSTEELKLNMKTSVGGTPSTSDKATVIKEDDEPLGDMSFLIEVNSKISFFVSDTSTVECELKPMTARERNDVYKVAQLYKVRARIGTKAENNLTTVRLSKQADTKIPKPGSVDRLLSELSIAASKESPKNQVKRKYSATVVDNKQTGDGDVLDQDGPPKKRLSRQMNPEPTKCKF